MAMPQRDGHLAGAGAHPMANKVGWFNLNNINCGLLGMPLGFLVIYVVSLFTKAPSAEMQALVDEIRKPRGNTVSRKRPPDRQSPVDSAGSFGTPLLFEPGARVACCQDPVTP